MIALGVHHDLDALAKRIARVWGVAVGPGAIDAARAAVSPLAAHVASPEAELARSSCDVLERRRRLARPGFAALDGRAIELLARHAGDLYRTHTWTAEGA